jgi:acyl-CoA thioester hydrolase
MPGSFRMSVRVRLAETDALGVVYYGQYFGYFDIARLEMLREAGMTPKLLRMRKLGFVAGESSCRYHASARFDDVLTLEVKVARVGGSSVVYAHRITRGRTRIADGRVTDILVGADGKPTRITKEMRRRLERYAS